MGVILSEAKASRLECAFTATVKINEQMIHGGLKTLHADERSLATLGMQSRRSELTNR